MVLPGDETTVYLPEFPDFSNRPVDERPDPFQPGNLFTTVIGARSFEGHTYESWSYRDISIDRWEAYTISSWSVRFW